MKTVTGSTLMTMDTKNVEAKLVAATKVVLVISSGFHWGGGDKIVCANTKAISEILATVGLRQL